MLNNRTPDQPPEVTPEDMLVFAVYFLVLYQVLRAGAIGWACIMMIPLLLVMAFTHWDDL